VKQYSAEAISDKRFLLGEGPIYRPELEALMFVDITSGRLMHYFIKTGKFSEIKMGQYLGAAVPTTSGRYIAAMTTGVYLTDEQSLTLLCKPDELRVNLRLNDGKCDPRGRFVFGSMNMFKGHNERNSLFSIASDYKYKRLDTEVTLSNGLAWTSDGSVMYFNDSLTHGVDAFDYDLETGNIKNRRRIYTVIGNKSPDGMCIDDEGMLWVALWHGSCVMRIDPKDGREIGIVPLPAKHVTSCCFGGPNRDILYVTSSGDGCDGKDDGKLFAVKTDTTGPAAVYFDDSGE
jgi:sugar lactone lactonase YvrE